MGTAYTKTSPTNFVDGETINASDFTTEFDAIDAAFETGGHQHDGTDGEGGAIDIRIMDNDTDFQHTINITIEDGKLQAIVSEQTK